MSRIAIPQVVVCWCFWVVWCCVGLPLEAAEVKAPPPGNVYLAGEEVVVPVPGGGEGWELLSYRDESRVPVTLQGGRAVLGRLPVGFYRLRASNAAPGVWISLAVIEPLKSPTPARSPIALDVAMAWFYPPEKMEAAARLCALAGVNWVRDRMTWRELEPERGRFAAATRYDVSARAQAGAGLRVLQVHHHSPEWANPVTKRFPLDLRDAYRFQRELAQRWRGQVLAFEPWNEADIDVFGGHTGSEMASLQKAAYLGMKAGNPQVIACLNVWAHHRPAQLEDFHANAAWPYYDTYNFHHYEPYDRYPAVYADHRAVSGGRPLWITECAMPVKWAGDPALKELPDENLWDQSERLVKTFAAALHENPAMVFYFLLPHYVEGQTQFGIVRPDLSPRPAYVSLAAVGRLLAEARPLGRLSNGPTNVVAYLFKARPEGREREILVAWTRSGETPLACVADAAWDHLGRPKPANEGAYRLTPAPLFIAVKPRGPWHFEPPPKTPPFLPGKPSPVVLQVLLSAEQTVLAKSAAKVSTERPETLAVYAYNFSERPVRGTLVMKRGAEWVAATAQRDWPLRMELAPMERREIPLPLDLRGKPARMVETVRLEGDFGTAGRPVLSFNLMPHPPRFDRVTLLALSGAGDAGRWAKEISGGGELRIEAVTNGVVVHAEPKGVDRWVYPRLDLIAGERPPEGATGLAFELTVHEGEGKFRVIWREPGGASYVSEATVTPKPGETVETVALFREAVFGTGWSPLDPDGKLNPQILEAVKIGVSTPSTRVRYTVRNLRWVAY
ncbi:hypothetical protein NXS98_03655 [Fontisphaera persica]|uniref:hypothetical protein n=1 Tax=Fontisphaera persica TaxID=2974023 RepID=UPI0024BF5E98|nr:hypothetical protein [Fontisphaera persica]WCJ60237.1 hypothetical protein NXS98_03655 [Fontisphaera persica]